MNIQFLKRNNLRSSEIEELNQALIVLKHFIELNHKLLPLLHTLYALKDPTERDINDMQKIKVVFSSYDFEANSSVLLMNSPILEIIQKNYETVFLDAPRVETQYQLSRFTNEYARLSKNWHLISLS
jgi:hypothetical protein